MADVHLPSTLPPLFPGLPRHLEIDAETVDDAIGVVLAWAFFERVRHEKSPAPSTDAAPADRGTR